MAKKIILTGDRPTGKLHIGHYVGSLQNRVKMQHEYDQYIVLADLQALTDNADNPEKVRKNITEVVLDYLAVGIDPKISTIFIQSMIPQIAELTILYLNLVTTARLARNPTVKEEIRQRGFDENMPAGFFMYPVHQAADITVVKGEIVPVGEDQQPMIEQTNEIIRSFNRLYAPVFPEVQAIIPKTGRLVGIDGQAKMSKSLNNAIYLSDEPDELRAKIMKMYTDPGHLKVEDPGKIEGNTVFAYLDTFGTDTAKIQELKDHYQRGGLGDVVVKKYLLEVMDDFLAPIRERRKLFNHDDALQIAKAGTEKVQHIAAQTMDEVKKALGIKYF